MRLSGNFRRMTRLKWFISNGKNAGDRVSFNLRRKALGHLCLLRPLRVTYVEKPRRSWSRMGCISPHPFQSTICEPHDSPADGGVLLMLKRSGPVMLGDLPGR